MKKIFPLVLGLLLLVSGCTPAEKTAKEPQPITKEEYTERVTQRIAANQLDATIQDDEEFEEFSILLFPQDRSVLVEFDPTIRRVFAINAVNNDLEKGFHTEEDLRFLKALVESADPSLSSEQIDQLLVTLQESVGEKVLLNGQGYLLSKLHSEHAADYFTVIFAYTGEELPAKS